MLWLCFCWVVMKHCQKWPPFPSGHRVLSVLLFPGHLFLCPVLSLCSPWPYFSTPSSACSTSVWVGTPADSVSGDGERSPAQTASNNQREPPWNGEQYAATGGKVGWDGKPASCCCHPQQEVSQKTPSMRFAFVEFLTSEMQKLDQKGRGQSIQGLGSFHPHFKNLVLFFANNTNRKLQEL